jgi:predicted DNA-binding protein
MESMEKKELLNYEKQEKMNKLYTFRIETNSLDNLKEIADGRSVTYMINTAIKEYISKFEDSSNDR